jgi:hypothetical protein
MVSPARTPEPAAGVPTDDTHRPSRTSAPQSRRSQWARFGRAAPLLSAAGRVVTDSTAAKSVKPIRPLIPWYAGFEAGKAQHREQNRPRRV